MRPEDQVRLRHLAEAATKAVAHGKDKQRKDLDSDELLRLALTKLVEIVGEAAKHVSPELRAANPDVPWAAAARMRDRLIHHYFDVNLDVLWQTVTDDLPRLLAALPVIDAE
ncbi:MAG: HepT-like ribonuclease domain-containing protein [Pseudonocardia sp.]